MKKVLVGNAKYGLCRRRGRHDDDELCFCPDNREDVRKVLTQKWINGWVHEDWYTHVRNLVRGTPTHGEMEALLYRVEESANECYGMWRNSL